jgi:hypothetical protein
MTSLVRICLSKHHHYCYRYYYYQHYYHHHHHHHDSTEVDTPVPFSLDTLKGKIPALANLGIHIYIHIFIPLYNCTHVYSSIICMFLRMNSKANPNPIQVLLLTFSQPKPPPPPHPKKSPSRNTTYPNYQNFQTPYILKY